ncbi:hypothetical protein WBK50_12750 [Pseudonocardia sp. T1-2H]|uniref:hypothetical protein n=1 Tax=Pseudonocardia sp. T1-2H TaxID=3128899 RepID=UPI0031015054
MTASHAYPGSGLVVARDGAVEQARTAPPARHPRFTRHEPGVGENIEVEPGGVHVQAAHLGKLAGVERLRDGAQRVQPENLRDPDSVDQRRAAVGLDTMAKHLELMREPPPEHP